MNRPSARPWNKNLFWATSEKNGLILQSDPAWLCVTTKTRRRHDALSAVSESFREVCLSVMLWDRLQGMCLRWSVTQLVPELVGVGLGLGL